jgi:uncharacterized cupredoxin-like copper-binding protein
MENQEQKGIFERIWLWFKNLTVKGLLRAIFVVFIIIVILMSVTYLPSAISRISSSLTGALYSVFVPAESATMTADKKIINSGDEFTVSFKKGDAADGLFTVVYSCEQDIDLLAVESTGLKNINCDTPYYLLNNNNTLRVRAMTNDESVVRLVLTGALENNDTQKSEIVGVARVTVTNDTVGTVPEPTTSNPTKPTYVAPSVPYNPAYSGKADLAVRVLQVGRLNTATNLITSQTQFTYGDTVGIRFEVRNDGDANTGSWNFTAALPSVTTPSYTAPTQVSLRPGESIQFTLGFSALTNQYNSMITVNVDSTNMVPESNEGNNMLTSTITSTGSNYSNNYYDYNNNYSNTGCYVNGVFSYNCLGGDNYNYNNYNYGNLNVTCYASPNNPDTDEKVHWYANVYGGSGDYDYDWSGTNSLNSSSQNPTKTYTSGGTKYATVEVTDDRYDYRASQTCSIYVDDNGNNNNNEDVDLSVEILAVGKINSSGNFVEDDNIEEGDDAAVRFRVENEGDEDSGSWDYEVDLTPSFSGDTYEDSNMSSLDPGESITITVEFDNVEDTGTNRFRVEVDPGDDIGDDERDNNDDTMSIDVD